MYINVNYRETQQIETSLIKKTTQKVEKLGGKTNTHEYHNDLKIYLHDSKKINNFLKIKFILFSLPMHFCFPLPAQHFFFLFLKLISGLLYPLLTLFCPSFYGGLLSPSSICWVNIMMEKGKQVLVLKQLFLHFQCPVFYLYSLNHSTVK